MTEREELTDNADKHFCCCPHSEDERRYMCRDCGLLIEHWIDDCSVCDVIIEDEE